MRKPRHIAQVLMGMACVVFAVLFFPIVSSLLFGFSQWRYPEIYILACSVLFFILAGSSIAVSLLFWRCPKCGKGFPLRYGAMDRAECCPFCGEKIC